MNIIITGASRGIGYQTAKLLSAEHKVLAIARSPDKLQQLKKDGNSKNIFPVTFDFEKGNIRKDLLPEIKKQFQSVDVLVNNAATLLKKYFEEISPEDIERVFKVNLFSIAELTQALIPMMLIPPSPPPHSGTDRERADRSRSEHGEIKSHVLNIASMGGIQGSVKFPGLSAYSSSKGALITLTECLAEEYKEKNIRFNAIAFGAVQTEMLAEAFPKFQAPITAENAAKFVADFAVNGHNYFNGKILQMALSTP